MSQVKYQHQIYRYKQFNDGKPENLFGYNITANHSRVVHQSVDRKSSKPFTTEEAAVKAAKAHIEELKTAKPEDKKKPSDPEMSEEPKSDDDAPAEKAAEDSKKSKKGKK